MARPHQRLEHEAMLDEPELRELFVEGRNLRSELTSMKSIRADRQAAKCCLSARLRVWAGAAASGSHASKSYTYSSSSLASESAVAESAVALHFEVVTGGITLGGLPIGTDGFHASQLRAKVSTLNDELSKLGLVQHGFMFKTLVRASHLQKLRFFLQGSSPFLPRVQSQIRRFDLSVHLALEKYHRWPSSQYLAAHPDLLEFARFKRELPHSRGGDEFTPSEGLHPAVYYTAIARFLAWYSDQPMSRMLPSPHSLDVHCSRSLRAQKHPLATFFVEAHDFVHNAGAILYRRVKAPAPAADGAAIPPAPAAVPDDAGRPPASVVHIPGALFTFCQ
ncbi:hypothetical protein GUITHDRAFT_117785 [Guillardia theta CCMP2712]|uniref:Uncharacterized protein n=1 Tax=Guillardia theta (strain CCMP2712) TaxID=905079 RepID=L1IIQ3_GUITC|nr:hypothetical protein GUITHDRAFT_117785 [Guillardia theta CCMP2712]EKX36116.1 hypothetical protein GUITHDRAFT_117785 [Guillardia theta CCMP2712]|eukprot:XP_005823096.1 hypothetical protein GUITHDRAFT_117785 [Guillardia theta CCMP2712]